MHLIPRSLGAKMLLLEVIGQKGVMECVRDLRGMGKSGFVDGEDIPR